VTGPILVGHSDGGSIALIAAGAGAIALRALVLEAPHVFVEDVTSTAIRRLRDRYQTTDWRDHLARHHGANTDQLFATWTGVWLDPGFRSWNIEDAVDGVDCPTLVIQGRDDEYGTHRQVDAIAEGIGAGCTALMLDDCGHTPHVDQRQAVEDALVQFVACCIRD